MKKVLQVLGFALVAMMLFAGCGKKDKWKDVDQPVTELTFSDGNWVAEAYTCESEEEGGYKFENETEAVMEFTVAGDKYSITKGSSKSSATYPSEVPSASLETIASMYKLMGMNAEVSGHTISYTEELDSDDLASYKDITKSYFLMVINHEIDMPEDNKFKTNEDKTKYRFYAEDEETGAEMEITFVKQ